MNNVAVKTSRIKACLALLAGGSARAAENSNDRAMWHELAIGRKIVQWFESASMDDPSLFQHGHPHRPWIQAMGEPCCVLGR